MPYVEYTSNVDEDVTQKAKATVAAPAPAAPAAAAPAPVAPQQPRAVAKKSTAKKQSNADSTTTTAVTPYVPPVEMKPSHSIVVSNCH